MRVLDLVLTHKWYDMTESGEKPEEYRNLCPYWCKRLMIDGIGCKHVYSLPYIGSKAQCGITGTFCKRGQHNNYTHVRFHRGYTSTIMTFEIRDITIGKGNPDWGAPTDKDVFIIKHGKRI